MSTTLAQAREAARQLAGFDAVIVHQYLQQQQQLQELATRLALELRYCLDVLTEQLSDHEVLEDFTWYRDGSAVLAEFKAINPEDPHD